VSIESLPDRLILGATWWRTYLLISLAIHESSLHEIRGAKVPSRNGLSHSNRSFATAWLSLNNHNSKTAYPGTVRLVRALMEIDGKEQVMEFLTNNLEWSASSVTDLYRCRWQIEVFFKSIKQNLQIGSFLGHNANAVRWQIWIGLLVHLLMRFLKWKSQWKSHFGRLFTIIRCVMWKRWEAKKCLEFYGTAGAKRTFSKTGIEQDAAKLNDDHTVTRL